jgi:hypothetical protein
MRKFFLLLLVVAASCMSMQALTVDNTAGNLAQQVTDTQITELTVTGTLDARDFLFITNELTELAVVDLSQATIVPFNAGKALYGTVTNYQGNEIPRTAFFGKKLTSVTLPANIQSIGFAAFAGCDHLQQVMLPASVTYIADYAFAGTALTSIDLPEGIQGMGKGVFSRCEALTTANINAKYVGDFAFLGDINLSQVNIGANVNSILMGVFNGCTALQTINFDPACRMTRIDDEAFINSGLESIDIAALGVGTIGDWAFAQTQLSSLTLPNGMTQLGVGSLSHNHMLENVNFPGVGHAADPSGRGDGLNEGGYRAAPSRNRTISEVKDYTFAGDELLYAGDMLREGVTRLGNYALYNVSQDIDTMRLPSTIVYLGDMAMAGMIGMGTLRTYAVDVPELGEEVWAGVDQPSVLLVAPDAESTELYKVADQWMYFFFQADDDFIVGDVNRDGHVDINDVTALISLVLGTPSEDNLDMRAADVYADGTVDINDITAIINIVLGNSSSKAPSRLKAINYERFAATSDALTLSQISLQPGETRTIEVALNNSERDYTAMQCELVLPQGVTLTGIEGIDRGSRHTYFSRRNTVEDNVYTLIGVSMGLNNYAGSEGNILKLTLTATDEFNSKGAEVALTNVMLVTHHDSFLADDALSKVNEGSGIEMVTAGKQVANVRYVNLAGQESDVPFSGMNIVVTTYTDGTISTVKVMK